MPFVVLMTRDNSVSKPVWETTDIIFDDPQEAAQYCKAENLHNTHYSFPIRFKIKPISLDDPLAWRLREQSRFDSGEYKRPPWYEDGYDTHMFDHIDPNDPTKVRFFNSQQDAWRGKYTSMSPGRFVKAYIDSYMDDWSIDRWCARMGLEETTSKLLLATTAEQILKVYQSGPHSCMSYDHKDGPFRSKRFHPVEVYADSDLAVAYIERHDEVTGRCLVWPEKKIHGRIYGDIARMQERLRQAGYKEDWEGFVGAKINLIRSGKFIVAPYFDGECGAVEDNDKLIISDKPSIILKSPYGTPSATECTLCGKSGVHLKVKRNCDNEITACICAEGCQTE